MEYTKGKWYAFNSYGKTWDEIKGRTWNAPSVGAWIKFEVATNRGTKESPDTNHVLTISFPFGYTEENFIKAKSHANLISASKEMYEALKQAQKQLDYYLLFNNDSPIAVNDNTKAVLIQTQSAIQKAEGKE